MLSNSLIFLASSARMLPDGTSFFSEKYSVSSTSNEFGWVMTRLVTSSVVALVHRRSEIAQNLRLGGMDIGKSGNRARPRGEAGDARGALEQGTAVHAFFHFQSIGHGHLQGWMSGHRFRRHDGCGTEGRQRARERGIPDGKNALADAVIGGVELAFGELGGDIRSV